LLERGRAVAALEQEVRRRERMVQDLVGALEDAQRTSAMHEPAQLPAEALATEEAEALRRKLDALAADFARREADIQAGTWRIAELEQELASRREERARADTDAATESEAETETQLAAALDEIDVLKQALAQEHEARKRAEARASVPAGEAAAAERS
jgi:hypothetical protein